MSDWSSQPEAKTPIHAHANTKGEQSIGANSANQPSSSKKSTRPPPGPNSIASTSTTHLVVGPGRTTAIMKRRPSVQKYPLRSSAANMTMPMSSQTRQSLKKAPNPSTMTLRTSDPRVRSPQTPAAGKVVRVSAMQASTLSTSTPAPKGKPAAEMNDATFQAISRTMKILEDDSAAAEVEAAIYHGSPNSRTKVNVKVKASGGRERQKSDANVPVQNKKGVEKGPGLTEAEEGVEKKSEVKQKLKDKLARVFSRKLTTGTESTSRGVVKVKTTDVPKFTPKPAPASTPGANPVAVAKSVAPSVPKQGPSKPKTVRSTASKSTSPTAAVAIVGAPSPAAAAAARVRARNGGRTRSRGVQFSGLRARDDDRDSDYANADTDVGGDSPPSPGRSASRMMAAARVRYLNAASEGFGARFHFNKKLRPKTPAKKRVLQVKPTATQSSFKKLVPSPRREKRQGRERAEHQGERQLRDDKYYVPTPYKFHATQSSQSLLQGPPPQPSVTIEYKNPKSLSAFKSKMEAVYDNDTDRERDTSTLGSSTISVFKAQDAREDVKSKKSKMKAKTSTITKDKDIDELLKSKTKPMAKPVKSMKSDTPTALLLGPKPDLSSESAPKLKPKLQPATRPGPKQLTPFCTTCKKNPTIHSSPVLMAEFTATLERLRTKIQDVKLREAAVAELDTKIEARSQELKGWQAKVAQAAAPTTKEKHLKLRKEALQAKLEETEAALRKFADLEANARDRVEKRLRLQPVAVLEDLRTSESLQDNAYLQETLVHFFELLKLCEGSMHEDWFDAGFVGKVKELDAELGKRLGIKDKDNTPKATGAEGAGEDHELNLKERAEPRGCHSAVGHGHGHGESIKIKPATARAGACDREPGFDIDDSLDPNSNLNSSSIGTGIAARPKST